MAAHDAAGLTPPLPGLTPGAATQGEQMEISNTKQANRQMVKRGPEFMADIKKLADKEAGLTLQAVAEKHGLTRERIRQLFFILYGTPYTEAVNGKREHKKHIKFAAKIEKHSIEHRFRNYRKEGNHSEAVTPEDRQADPLKQAARITGRGHKTRAFEPCARRHRASAG